MADVALVVPCFNEAVRLDVAAFRDFALGDGGDDGGTRALELLFVDDGSDDSTRQVLDRLVASMPGRARVISLEKNSGKAEAVRQGMLAALSAVAGPPRFVGYWDADLATPLAELPRFLEVFAQHPEMSLVVGSRVKLMGRLIHRRPWRHYLGRVFATAASQTLGLPVYDTQCGAKLLRVDASTARLFADPFVSGWIFDVELLARFLRDVRDGHDRIYELPLDTWTDIDGSKVKPADFLRSAAELAMVWKKYPRSRKP